MNILLISENISNGQHNSILLVFSLAAILNGILVIVSKNPILSVLFLIGLFLIISVYLLLLGLNFIGLSYILVYVGAVSILFLFILMLINIRISEISSSTTNTIPLAIILGTLFLSRVEQALPTYFTKQSNNYSSILIDYVYSISKYYDIFTGSPEFTDRYDYYTDIPDKVEVVTYQVWETMLAQVSHITTLGNILYTSYPLWIILTCLLLLLSMVGAIIITVKN